MADLGAIGIKVLGAKTVYGQVVKGTVYDDAAAPAQRRLMMYNRSTGTYTGRAISDATGAFTLYAKITEPNQEHFVVCFDDEAGTDYNDQILGRVVPL